MESLSHYYRLGRSVAWDSCCAQILRIRHFIVESDVFSAVQKARPTISLEVSRDDRVVKTFQPCQFSAIVYLSELGCFALGDGGEAASLQAEMCASSASVAESTFAPQFNTSCFWSSLVAGSELMANRLACQWIISYCAEQRREDRDKDYFNHGRPTSSYQVANTPMHCCVLLHFKRSLDTHM